MKEELKQKEGRPKGYYWYEFGGRKYSVVDFGTTMATHPMPEGLFLGWEAMEVINGHLGDEVIRASSWPRLQKTLNEI